MNGFTLNRFKSDHLGTFGKLRQNGQMLCYTCELPWLDNEPTKSCIPEGTYQCISFSSAHHPDCWQIVNVHNRTGILIHAGNTELDSLGCVLVGDSLGTVDGLPAVLNSVKTLEELRNMLPDLFTLDIINNF